MSGDVRDLNGRWFAAGAVWRVFVADGDKVALSDTDVTEVQGLSLR